MNATRGDSRMGDPRMRWLDAAGLVVFALLLLQNSTLHLDLHPADEALYQAQGLALLRADVTAHTLAFSPVYSAAYAVLQVLGLHGATAQDAMAVLLVVGSALCVWWALLPLVPRVAALVAAAWWVASPLAIAFPLRVYLFNASLCFVAIGLGARGHAGRGLGLLFVAALNRMEIAPWLLGAAGCYALAGWFGKNRGVAARGAVFLAAGLGLFFALSALPQARERSWHAFRWHYVRGFEAAEGAVAAHPNAPDPARVQEFERAFEGSESIVGAMLEHPGAFAGRLLDNATALPEMVRSLVGDPYFHLPAARYTLLGVAAFLLALGLLVGFSAGPRRVMGLLARGGALPNLMWWTSVCVLPVLLVMYPRPDFGLVLALPLLVLGARIAHLGGAKLLSRARLPEELGPVALVLAAILLPSTFGRPCALPRPFRDCVRVLERNDLPDDARILMAQSTRSVLVLARKEATAVGIGVAYGAVGAPVGAGFDGDPDHVLLTTWDYRAPHAQSLLSELTDGPWQLVDAGYDVWLFRRTR